MVGDWQHLLDDLPPEARAKAIAAYELAYDRAAGQPVDIATATLRAAATAEGLDDRQPWIEAGATCISATSTGP